MPGNREDLADTFAAFGYRRGAEVGVERGLYAEVLCQAIPGLQLFCIDAWKTYREYREHVTQEKLDGFYRDTGRRLAGYQATLIRAWSVDAARTIPDGWLDFVYLDGNHIYQQVTADLAAWAPKVRIGGMVSGHDYCRRKRMNYGVIEAVREWTAAHGIKPWFVLRGDSSPSWMWIQR